MVGVVINREMPPRIGLLHVVLNFPVPIAVLKLQNQFLVPFLKVDSQYRIFPFIYFFHHYIFFIGYISICGSVVCIHINESAICRPQTDSCPCLVVTHLSAWQAARDGSTWDHITRQHQFCFGFFLPFGR